MLEWLMAWQELALNSATALGTVGAVVAALWIARSDWRKSTRERYVTARLVAATVWPSVAYATTRTDAATRCIQQYLADDLPDAKSVTEALCCVREAVDALDLEQVHRLAALPGDCALALAAAVGNLKLAELQLRSWPAGVMSYSPKLEEAMKLILEHVGGASTNLNIAGKEIDNARMIKT